MSVHYDPSIITKHAQALYNRASGIIFMGACWASSRARPWAEPHKAAA